MSRLTRGVLTILAAAGMAGAATVTCPSLGSPVNVDSGLVVQCGGLTFNNFQVIPFGGDPTPTVVLGSADTTGGTVNLTFNPNMSAPAGNPQDIHLFFDVSGGISGIDLGVGGTGATIVERACSAPIPTTGPTANLCPDGSLLATFTAFSSPPGPNFKDATFAPQSGTVHLYKDIGVVNGGLSDFTQSFHANVPEPETFLLLGPALLGLGFIRKRLAKRV